MMQTGLAMSILTRATAPAVERSRDDRGMAAVEFALIFPVMLSLMFGMASVTEQLQVTRSSLSRILLLISPRRKRRAAMGSGRPRSRMTTCRIFSRPPSF